MNVTKTIPNYLRIHKAPALIAAPDLDPSGDPVSHFWHVFGDTTGWRVDTSRRRSGDEIELLPMHRRRWPRPVRSDLPNQRQC